MAADKNGGSNLRAKRIIRYNHTYLLLSLIMMIFFNIRFNQNFYSNQNSWLKYILFAYIWALPLSRCNEIFYAFIRDALDKVAQDKPQSALTFHKRIELSLYSYLELIANFSIIYYVLPFNWFKADKPFQSIIDSFYFSGITITTVGYGDYSPIHWIPRLLVVYEVLCGFILLIVSFAIYAGRGLNEKTNRPHRGNRTKRIFTHAKFLLKVRRGSWANPK